MPVRESSLTKLLITFFLVIPSLLILSGCASKGSVDPNNKKLSVVFGYFDMKDAPSWGGIDWVSLKQYKPKVSYYDIGVTDGMFWHVGVANGSYQVDQFGRNTRFYSNTRYTYNFGGQGRNETSIIIKRPGVYFLGSYKYKEIESGSFFKPDNFDMIKSPKPTEKELLKKILKLLTEDSDYKKYKYQRQRVMKRLKQLNRKTSKKKRKK